MGKSKGQGLVIARAVGVAVLALFAARAAAAYEPPNPLYLPPADYYNSATGTGAALKSQLYSIISNGNVVSRTYGDAREYLQLTDRDPNNPANVLLIYNRASVPATWDALTWHREHIWPQSLLGLSSVGNTHVGTGSDAFGLRPINPSINNSRGNSPFGTFDSSGAHGLSGGYWYPSDDDAGDSARAIFYMATRYGQGQTNNLTLVNGQPATYQMGDLQSMLRYHYTDPIDNFERRRNHLIYSSDDNPLYYQGNRNPYVDHPEWVWSVFGGGNNNSQLSVGAAAPAANGSSSASVNLRVMRNGAWGSDSVTLNKSGTHPTTYDVLTSGSAVTPAAGPGQTFDYNSQSRSIGVSLNASTATVGAKGGTVVIDNTDISTGGTGKGSADANDVINVLGQVVDDRVITASTANFGRIVVGGNGSAMTTLSSPGSDDANTRVRVTGHGSTADTSGVFIAAIPSAGHLFNGTLTTATRSLQGNFAEPGEKSGSRAFAVEGEGLAGESVNGVSVSYVATVVDHATASFAGDELVSGTTIDFGYVPVELGERRASFGIHNLASPHGAALTAGLDVDGVSAAEGSGAITTDVLASNPADPIAPGAARLYTATFAPPPSAGPVSTSQTIAVSDENLPGGVARPALVLTATGHAVTDGTFPATGFINLLAGETYVTGGFAIGSNATLTKTGPGAINVTGAQSHGTDAELVVTGGSVTLDTDAGATLAVHVNPSAIATFNATQHLRALEVAGGSATVSADGGRAVVTASLDVTAGGKLDLTDNRLIVLGGNLGTWDGQRYSGITGLLQTGRNEGDWGGSGIVTSMPDALTDYTTLGVATAADALGIASSEIADWRGHAVTGSDVLVSYTYGGDANLDGVINIDDYGQIDFNVGLSGVVFGYFNGDFNYDGLINIDDYGIIDFNIGIQGPLLSAADVTTSVALASTGVTMVPEPAVLTLLPLLLLPRRRRPPT